MSIGLWKRRRKEGKKWKLGSFYWSKFRGAIQWQVALCVFRWCKESPTLFLPRGVPQGRARKLWSVVSKRGMLNLKCGTREKQINASGCTLRQQHCPRKHSGKKKNIFFAIWHKTFLPMILKNHRGEPPSARTHMGQSQAWGEAGETHQREKTLPNVTQSVVTCGLKNQKIEGARLTKERRKMHRWQRQSVGLVLAVASRLNEPLRDANVT